jgi:hypothetical protein
MTGPISKVVAKNATKVMMILLDEEIHLDRYWHAIKKE